MTGVTDNWMARECEQWFSAGHSLEFSGELPHSPQTRHVPSVGVRSFTKWPPKRVLYVRLLRGTGGGIEDCGYKGPACGVPVVTELFCVLLN